MSRILFILLTDMVVIVHEYILCFPAVLGVMVRSDTDVLSQITRSVSVPNGVESFQDDSILDITVKQRYQ